MGLQEEIERIIRRIRVHRCAVPFVIWFRGRSGSTHLCSLLNHHPQIKCRREDFSNVYVDEMNRPPIGAEVVAGKNGQHFRRLIAFDDTYVDDPKRNKVIQHLHDIYSFPYKACGFKFKFPIQVQLFSEVTEELAKLRKSLRIITLGRRNVIKQAISYQNKMRILRLTHGGANLLQDGPPDSEVNFPFQVDVDSVIANAREFKSTEAVFLESVSQIRTSDDMPHMKIDYEDLLEDQSRVIKQVFEFLDVDPAEEISSHVHKATPDDLSVAIRNYDELRNSVKGTEFESLV